MVDEMFQWKYTAEVVILLEYEIQGNPNLTIGEIVGIGNYSNYYEVRNEKMANLEAVLVFHWNQE